MKNYIKRATVILSLVMAMSVPVNVHAEEYSGEPTDLWECHCQEL